MSVEFASLRRRPQLPLKNLGDGRAALAPHTPQGLRHPQPKGVSRSAEVRWWPFGAVGAVAHGPLLGVDPGWWPPDRETVGVDPDLPVAVFDEAVVVAAHQDSVGQAGGAAGSPGFDVMSLGPGEWPVTAGEGAAAISEFEGAAESALEEASLVGDVHRAGVTVQDGGEDAGVAGPVPRSRGEIAVPSGE